MPCRVENSVSKGEIACKSNFSFSHNVFHSSTSYAALCGNGLTLSQTKNFRLFQTERVADDNCKFDENCDKFSKWVENPVEKGEIACY